MNPDTTPTPRTDAKYKDHPWDLHDHIPVEFCRQLERELSEKANEVERIRELLNRAIEIAEKLEKEGLSVSQLIDLHHEIDAVKKQARLAPAPEEPVSKCDGNHGMPRCNAKPGCCWQDAPAPEESVDKGEISDGYHTFNELYDHRCTLFLALLQRVPSMSWISKKHDDGSSFDGWFIAGMRLPSGDVTYHLPEKMWDLAVKTGAEQRNFAPKWDGHKSPDVVIRLQEWIKLAAPAPEEQKKKVIITITAGEKKSVAIEKLEATLSVLKGEIKERPLEKAQEAMADFLLGIGKPITASAPVVDQSQSRWFKEGNLAARPLEDEIKRIEWHQNYSEPMIYHAIADSIRYLRDEIERMKLSTIFISQQIEEPSSPNCNQ